MTTITDAHRAEALEVKICSTCIHWAEHHKAGDDCLRPIHYPENHPVHAGKTHPLHRGVFKERRKSLFGFDRCGPAAKYWSAK